MCGIFGFMGDQLVPNILLRGLDRLEYRGYDSAGIAMLGEAEIDVRRCAGKTQVLRELLHESPVEGSVGIAHTRWATHGEPSLENAHPHVDSSGQIALVHNGIIENHATIRTFLEQHGVEFSSETDTEVLAQLIGYFYRETDDLLGSIRRSLQRVHGSFATAVLCAAAPRTLIAARRGSPLIVGLGDDEFVVSSDGNAIAEHTSRVMYLDDNEIVTLTDDGVSVTNIDAQRITKHVETLDVQLEEIDLAAYEHHMQKEIFEQPESLRNAMRGRISDETNELRLHGLEPVDTKLPHSRRLLMFGCGTAWHAGLVGRFMFEELAALPTDVEYSSELRYRNPIIEEGTVGLAISQSGETADTLAALREVRTRGASVLGLVNTVGSAISRETDAGIYLHVGPEIGVASTKAFTAQLTVLMMMAVYVGRRRHLSPERAEALLEKLREIPDKVEQALELNAEVKRLAERLGEWDNWLYLGRGVNYPVALEGALKLKEISYVHAEGLPAAEMKHGPIAMIDPGMPVVMIASRDRTYGKILSNIEEVRSRGGHVVAVTTHHDPELIRIADDVLQVPDTDQLLSPLLTTIPLQLLAYHMAIVRGHDVDQPRNLAKCVTVE